MIRVESIVESVGSYARLRFSYVLSPSAIGLSMNAPTCTGSITHVLRPSLFHDVFRPRRLLLTSIPLAAHLQSPFEAASGEEAIDWQLRVSRQRTIVKRNGETTTGKASSAAPTRGNRREQRETEEMEDVTDSLLTRES